MRKRKAIIITIIMLLIGATRVMAAEPKVTIEGENAVEVGKSQKVSIKIASEETIGVVSGTIKAEGNITIKSVAGKNNWNITYNSETGTFNILKAEGAKAEEIMEIEYTGGSKEGTGKIIISGVNVTTTEYETKEMGEISKTIEVEEVEVEDPEDPEQPEEPEDPEDPTEEKTLTKIEVGTKPSKTKYKAGEKFSKTGMKIIAKYSDGSSKEVTNYTYSPKGELKTTDKEITITYSENGVSKTAKVTIEVEKEATGGSSSGGGTTGKDDTVAKENLSDAGAEQLIIPISIVAVLIGVSYIGYRKYKKI